jgi:aminopeptidase N
LKARYRLTLDVPASWRAVSNGEMLAHEVTGERAVFRFAETKPISTYLFAFAAGEFKVETAERAGRTMNMYHRETDAAKVARNVKVIFDLHETALNWLEDYTGIEYPFGKFDFMLIPSFQFNGMEHPGSIFYRASSLLLDESATQSQKLGQASLIAHETAHIWFGDLVTMNWFDDVWTKEVFANFMAAKIVNPSFPEINHDLRFLLTHYPAAYEVDRTEGTNPIRQQLDNLNEASTLYGAIIYQKAPIIMRQLELLVGEAAFRDGLREYLNTFQFGNTTWPDLIEILDRRSDEDLKSWSRLWVQEAGRPQITPYLALNADETISSLTLRQSDPKGQGRLWNQRLEVLIGYRDKPRYFPVHLSGESVLVEGTASLPKPDFILANGKGTGYGYFELDPLSKQFLMTRLPSLKDDLTRAIAWVTLWDAMLERQVSPEALIELTLKALPAEKVELNVQRITEYLTSAYWRFIPATARKEFAPRIEELLWRHIEKAPATSLKSTYFKAFSSIALTGAGLQKLERVWRKEATISRLPFSEQDYMTMALELAVREVPGWSDILNEQLGRIQDPERKARFAFVMPALSADPSVRDAFFKSLASVENRRHEPWVLEALTYLHHPLRAEQSEKYIGPSLELVEEIQRTGGIFFPKGWLDATLGGHSSGRAAAIVQQFLADHPNYPPRLRGKILQSADGLFRAAAISEK